MISSRLLRRRSMSSSRHIYPSIIHIPGYEATLGKGNVIGCHISLNRREKIIKFLRTAIKFFDVLNRTKRRKRTNRHYDWRWR